MERFKVTFTDDSNKYSPTTRTVEVDADNDYHAELIVHSQFGTFTKAEGIAGLKKDIFVPSEKHIHIDKVKKVKKEKR
jgi:predicted RNA-binding protein (virulence factor B family)